MSARWATSGSASCGPATATAASASARSRTAAAGSAIRSSLEMAYRLGQDDFSLQLERLKAAKPGCDCPLGRRRGRRRHPEPDAGHGHEPAVLRLRPGRVRRVRRDRGRRTPRASFAAIPGIPDRQDPKLEKFRKAFRARFDDGAGNLRRPRLRRHEHADLGDPGGRTEPREDPRRAGLPAEALARRHRRHPV